MILENKRHVCLFAMSCLFGTVLFFRKGDIWLPILLILGAAILFFLITAGQKREAVITGGIAVFVACVAFSVCAVRDGSYNAVQEQISPESVTELRGVVRKKEARSEGCRYTLKTPYKKVLVYSDTDEVPIGSAVDIHGSAEGFSHARNDGNFDFADYYRGQNISFRMFADDMDVLRSPRLPLKESLYQIQKRISAVFFGEMNERDAGVMAALATGNRGQMDEEVREAYQDAGISHILAISGLHISFLGFGVFRFLRAIRRCRLFSAGFAGAVVACFVVMSGMSASSARALVMFLLFMGAEVLGRAYDSVNALSAAALVLLFWNPQNLWQSGFLFSFSALLALVLSSRVIAGQREARRTRAGPRGSPGGGDTPLARLPQNLKGNLLSGIFLQLFLLPLTAWFYFEVPVYALFLNLLVIPLCSWLLGVGMLGGAVGIFFPELSKWILIPCHLILLLYEKAIALVNLLPFSDVVTGRPSAGLLLLYYAVLACVCLFYIKREGGGLTGSLPLFNKREGGDPAGSFVLPDPRRGMLTLALPVALLACILFLPRREECRIDFLDVGQGDGICLSDGSGAHIMIDGGSSSESEVGEYRIEPFLKYHRIQRVDAWILTHGDSDHYSGLLEALEDGYGVDCLLLSKSMPRDEAWESLVAAAKENGTEVLYAQAGDSLLLDGCGMKCLYPAAGDAADDANALSQVWSFERDGMSVLFTGDIGEEQEKELIARGVLKNCTVLKAAHHGSRYSSCAEFLEEVSPDYTVISCGENNSYGHPHAETLERLSDADSEIWQTRESGQITVCEHGGEWRLYTCVDEEE